MVIANGDRWHRELLKTLLFSFLVFTIVIGELGGIIDSLIDLFHGVLAFHWWGRRCTKEVLRSLPQSCTLLFWGTLCSRSLFVNRKKYGIKLVSAETFFYIPYKSLCTLLKKDLGWNLSIKFLLYLHELIMKGEFGLWAVEVLHSAFQLVKNLSGCSWFKKWWFRNSLLQIDYTKFLVTV